MSKLFAGQLISEAMAMFLIIAFGDSVAAMYTLYTPSPYQQAYWGVCIAWGLAVTIAIYTTASVSGCHGNPAVTLSLAIYRGFSWRKVVPYWLAQVVGGFLGAAIVYTLFSPVIDHYNTVNQLTRASGGAAHVFFTHPGLAITPMHAFGDEIILTAFLIFGIFADHRAVQRDGSRREWGGAHHWLARCAHRGVDGLSRGLGPEPGARLRPEALLLFFRWGSAAFPSPDNYWWIPIVAPLIGAVVGGGAYQLLIHPFLPARNRAIAEKLGTVDIVVKL